MALKAWGHQVQKSWNSRAGCVQDQEMSQLSHYY